MTHYTAQSARDAQRTNYGGKSYWDYLEESAHRQSQIYRDRNDSANALLMLTQSLSDALRGNDGD